MYETTYTYSTVEIVILVSVLAVPILAAMVAAFIVGRRRAVPRAGIAFVPLIGPWIVILRSIRTSLWWMLLLVIPYVGLGFAIWTAVVVPARHERTRWWALPFLIPIANAVAFLAYALTLTPLRTDEAGSGETVRTGTAETVVQRNQLASPTADQGVKYCMTCGHALPAHARYCSRCGEPTEAAR